ncbi:MAG: hypothetical protein ACTHJ8_12635 [Mucilaginibacter sp.]
MNNKQYMITGLLLLLLTSCKTPVERWLDGMVDFKQVKGKELIIQAARLKAKIEDTTMLNYKVRIYLGHAAQENSAADGSINFNYHVDSAFYVRVAGSKAQPVMIQPVNNGISGCYEYLLMMDINKFNRLKKLQLVYQDKFIDGKQYTINLN